MVEVAIYRPNGISLACVPCPDCNKGRPLHEWQTGWEQADPSITQVVWGWRRVLTAGERGSKPKGQVLAFKGKVQFTPNAEALDPHRKERKQAEKALKEEGWR